MTDLRYQFIGGEARVGLDIVQGSSVHRDQVTLGVSRLEIVEEINRNKVELVTVYLQMDSTARNLRLAEGHAGKRTPLFNLIGNVHNLHTLTKYVIKRHFLNIIQSPL